MADVLQTIYHRLISKHLCLNALVCCLRICEVWVRKWDFRCIHIVVKCASWLGLPGCLPVHLHISVLCPLNGFPCSVMLAACMKSVKKLQICLESDKKVGLIMWRLKYALFVLETWIMNLSWKHFCGTLSITWLLTVTCSWAVHSEHIARFLLQQSFRFTVLHYSYIGSLVYLS